MILLAAAMATAASVDAAAKPEISWSVMHPTAIDPDGAQTCRIDKNWKNGVWTVTVGKKGADYPGVLSIAALRAEVKEK